ncbi:MAG TPA: hypothetical protein VIE19_07920 [Lapillicoccus sp.]|jgi:hypothetical protein
MTNTEPAIAMTAAMIAAQPGSIAAGSRTPPRRVPVPLVVPPLD